MKNLIEIKNENGKQAVSVRDLHRFLEVKTDPILWAKRMFEYGFVQNEDYTVIKSENPVNQQITSSDYVLTLDTAKEISMLQRTDKGKQARRYFIEIEKKYKEECEGFVDEMELVIKIARRNIEIKREQNLIKQNLSEIKEEIKILKVRHETDPNFFTVVGYASLLGKQINLEFAKKLGKEASKICRDKNIEPSTIPDPRFGRVKTYPKNILETLFSIK